MVIPKREEIEKVQSNADEIENQINLCLASNIDYSKIIDVLSSEKAQETMGKNQNIYTLYFMSRILEFELNQRVPHTVFDGRNTREVIRLYRVLTLYLRRFEFDFPREYKIKAIEYILSEKVSIVAVMALINCNSSIIHKEKVVNELRKILSEIELR